MTRLAQLIGKEEGYGLPGKIPTLRNNPGDLRHSPHSQHPGGPQHAEDVGTIDTVADGWADLERQLQLYAQRGLTIERMITDFYAPSNENDSARYVRDVCAGLGLAQTASVAAALMIPSNQTV